VWSTPSYDAASKSLFFGTDTHNAGGSTIDYGTYAILCDPKMLAIGWHRRVKIEKWRDPRAGLHVRRADAPRRRGLEGARVRGHRLQRPGGTPLGRASVTRAAG